MRLQERNILVTPKNTSDVPRSWEPQTWLIVGLAAAYIVALAVVAFLPGATLIERLRALDGGICAQIPSHSFFPAGQQLPLCSRNSGIYLGFACTALVLLVSGRIRASHFPPLGVAIVLALAVAVMGLDGFNSLFNDLGLPHLYQPHNLLRLATGLGAGTAMAAFIIPVANALIWRADDIRSSFGSFRELAMMIPVLLLVFLATSSQAAVTLYPVALFSSAGLVAAVMTVNVVFALGIANRVGRYSTWRQFFPFVTLMVALAVLELMALFAFKSSLLNSAITPVHGA